ncbi:hypothetical protein evm_008162 [Chilo suppressalis]|nr:hypothetical protein evm_008162 [Chilo suppressalis]
MISALFLCIVVLSKIQENDALFVKRDELYKVKLDNLKGDEHHEFKVDNAKDRGNKEELAKVIEYLNTNSDVEFEQKDDKSIIVRDADTENFKLADIMEILQKNYDTRVAYNDQANKSASSVRVHVIKNSHILNDYIKSLRKRQSTSSSSDDDSDYSDFKRRFNDHNDVIENIDLRKEKGASNENTERKGLGSYLRDEVEKDNTKDIMQTFKDKKHNFKEVNNDDDNNRYIKEKKSGTGAVENVWDVITKDDETNHHNPKYTNYSKEKNKHRRKKFIDLESKRNREKDFDTLSKFKERKSDADKGRKHKISLENNENSWKKATTKKYEPWSGGKMKKNYDSVESRPKKKKVTYDWNDSPKTNKKLDDDWREWGKSKTTKKAWEQFGKTTRKWESYIRNKKGKDTYEKPSYVARIPEYNKAGRQGNGGFQGRTPIPFVGKKGIYEEN